MAVCIVSQGERPHPALDSEEIGVHVFDPWRPQLTETEGVRHVRPGDTVSTSGGSKASFFRGAVRTAAYHAARFPLLGRRVAHLRR